MFALIAFFNLHECNIILNLFQNKKRWLVSRTEVDESLMSPSYFIFMKQKVSSTLVFNFKNLSSSLSLMPLNVMFSVLT